MALSPLLRSPMIAPFVRRMHQPVLQGDRVLVELLARDDAAVRGWTDAQLARLHAMPFARGWDAWLVWLPLREVPNLQNELSGLQTARLPWARRPLVGKIVSAGVAVTGADLLQCTGNNGQGVTLAVIDSLWNGLSDAIDAGELPHLAGKAPYQSPQEGDNHGTACAEIVADMAPEADLVLNSASTLPELQQVLPKLITAGVQVASDSAGWTTGYSFADGTGKPCEFVKKARNNGLLWVASAGNEADHSMWIGPWQDSDGDGWLDFGGKNYATLVAQKGDSVSVELDWDDYPHSAIDLDLVVCSGGSGPCKEQAASNATQDGFQTPQEVLDYDFIKNGGVHIGIRLKPGSAVTKKKLGVRLAVNGDAANLDPWVAAGTIIDPAECKDAVAVGAIDADVYDQGPPSAYSSRGPTWDGRIKPDIAAPTSVKTMVMGVFDGTSAACPHMVGALALQMARAGQNAEEAVQALYEAAVPMGDSVPNDDYGRGRLQLPDLPKSCAPPPSPDAGPPADAGARAEIEPEQVDATAAPDATAPAADGAATPPSTATPKATASGCAARSASGDNAVAVLAATAAALAAVALRRRKLHAHTRG